MVEPEVNPPPDPEAESPSPEVEGGMAAAFGKSRASRMPSKLIEKLAELANGVPIQSVLLRDAGDVQDQRPIRPRRDDGEVPAQAREKYVVQGEIARGGVGIVVKGHDNELGRDVALKFLAEKYRGNAAVLQRFIEEAQIGGQLQHPGIVPVYDLGVEGDKPYFSMKLIKGRTLAEILAEREGQQGRRRFLDIFESVCQTMAYAHSRGVIHRDLKPANIMVGAFGEVQVVDWGMAKVLERGGVADERRLKHSQSSISIIETVRSQPGSGSRSLVGSVMGTPAYMPPEQAIGDVEHMDERSDVFALGAMLCEILTGQPPYLGTSEDVITLAANCDTEPAKARLAACGADQELVDLCVSCLRPALASRPASGKVLAERVGAYLHSVEERVQEARIDAAAANVRAAGERKARRLTAGLAASVLATLGLGMGAWVWSEREAGLRREVMGEKVADALANAETCRRKEDWQQAVAYVRQARSLLTGDAGDALCQRVEAMGERIDAAAAAARARAELERRNAALLARLQDVRQPHDDLVYLDDWARIAAEHRDAFAADGLDLLAGTVEDAVRVLGQRGASVALAAHVDSWAQAALLSKDAATCARLTKIADRVDGDAVRGELRAAFQVEGAERLKVLAGNDALATWPARSLALLGSALLRKRAARSALRVFEAGHEAHPLDFGILDGLGRALYRLRRHRAATRYLQVAHTLRPDSVEILHVLGNAIEMPGDPSTFREALRLYERALEKRSDDGHLWFHVAVCYSRVEDPQKAIQSYHKAIELSPDYRAAYANLANLLSKLDRHSEALEVANNGLRRFEHDIPLHDTRVTALIGLNEYATLEASYERLARAHPEKRYYRYRVVDALSLRRKFEPGIAMAEALTEEDREDHRAWGQLGRILEAAGRRDEASAAFRKALACAARTRRGDQSPWVCQWALGLARQGFGREAVDALLIELEHQGGAGPSATLHHALGLVYLGETDGDSLAVHHLAEAARLDPGSDRVHADHARALLRARRPDEAVAVYRRDLELNGRSTTRLADLGTALQDAGDLDGAIEALEGALELDPENISAGASLAGAYLMKSRGDEARRLVETLRALDGSHPSVLLALALVQRFDGDDVAAERSLRAVLAKAPAMAGAHALLGDILHARGEDREAEAALRESLRLFPYEGRALCYLAEILIGKGELEEAEGLLRRAQRAGDASGAAEMVLGRVFEARGDVEQATAAYQTAAERGNPGGFGRLAALQFNRGALEAARETCEAGLKSASGQKSSHVHLVYGLVLQRQQKHAEALEHARRATALAPRQVQGWQLVLGCLSALRRYGEVPEVLAELRRLAPDDPRFWYEEGLVLHHQGRERDALASLQKTVARFPDYAPARCRLAYQHFVLGEVAAGQEQLQRVRARSAPAARAALCEAVRWLAEEHADHVLELARSLVAAGPDDYEAVRGFAAVLFKLRRFREAELQYRKLVALRPPGAPDTLCNIGHCLMYTGRADEAVALYTRGHELSRGLADWAYPSQEWIASARRQAEREAPMRALLGGAPPETAKAALAAVRLGERREEFGAMARLSQRAFELDPTLVDDLRRFHRYNAACWACRAAAGDGDGARLDAGERRRLREQAYAWLVAELAARRELAKTDKAWVKKNLAHQRTDPDLACIRDAAWLAKLDPAERDRYEAYWRDVAAALAELQKEG